MRKSKPKNKYAVALGRLGGLKRARTVSKERRKEIAKMGAAARWLRRNVHVHF
jgi:hypothetical protein